MIFRLSGMGEEDDCMCEPKDKKGQVHFNAQSRNFLILLTQNLKVYSCIGNQFICFNVNGLNFSLPRRSGKIVFHMFNHFLLKIQSKNINLMYLLQQYLSASKEHIFHSNHKRVLQNF